jgi:hypothetical protein
MNPTAQADSGDHAEGGVAEVDQRTMPQGPRGPAILVTGSIRSGTTWTGRILSLSGEAGYIHEPFNSSRWPGWTATRLPHRFLHINSENETQYEPIIEGVLRMQFPVLVGLSQIHSPQQAWRVLRDWSRSIGYRLRCARPLIKDPDAVFSADWLAGRFGMDVVVLIRHPAGFVSSIKRLGWSLFPSRWVEQESLLRDKLGPFAEQLRSYNQKSDVDLLDQAILLWKSIYHVVHQYQQRHSDWTFLRYEDLAERPVDAFSSLYQELGLTWDGRVEKRVASLTGASNPGEVPPSVYRSIRRNSRSASRTWLTRLSESEIDRIREGVDEVAKYFYGDQDWSLPDG